MRSSSRAPLRSVSSMRSSHAALLSRRSASRHSARSMAAESPIRSPSTAAVLPRAAPRSPSFLAAKKARRTKLRGTPYHAPSLWISCCTAPMATLGCAARMAPTTDVISDDASEGVAHSLNAPRPTAHGAGQCTRTSASWRGESSDCSLSIKSRAPVAPPPLSTPRCAILGRVGAILGRQLSTPRAKLSMRATSCGLGGPLVPLACGDERLASGSRHCSTSMRIGASTSASRSAAANT
mmetsp:Transcript_13174/g.34512  ORF Transcript_13174/g.34512 Transcript_13174/m.34512 type:complete len:238 (+) Transcript_13174:180-893(+)